MDKLDKIGWDGVRAELLEAGFDAAQVTAAVDKIQGLIDVPADKLAGALAESVPGLPAAVAEDLAAVADSLTRLAAERALNWQFDPTLVRGMGYYTGQVFEIIHPEMSSSVAGGGRYDKLIGRSLGQDVPACGFSIGFERIVDLLSGKWPGTRSRCWSRATCRWPTRWRWRGSCAPVARGSRGRARGGDRAAEREVRGPAEAAETAGFTGFVRCGSRTVRSCGANCGRSAPDTGLRPGPCGWLSAGGTTLSRGRLSHAIARGFDSGNCMQIAGARFFARTYARAFVLLGCMVQTGVAAWRHLPLRGVLFSRLIKGERCRSTTAFRPIS